MTPVRLVLLASVLAAAGAATVEKFIFETEDAVIVEAAGDPLPGRVRRQVQTEDYQRAQTVIPPGWPGLPAGVTDKCDTRDGRSGVCVARTICHWTRDLPPNDTRQERKLGWCRSKSRADGDGRRATTREVCCPGLFASTEDPTTPTTTRRPQSSTAGVTNWWQTTTKRSSTATVTQWWQTTEDPTRLPVTETSPNAATTTIRTTRKPTTSPSKRPTKKPTTTRRTTTRRTTTRGSTPSTSRRPLPSIPTIPPMITHPWQATSTSPTPLQTTGWWETTTDATTPRPSRSTTTRRPRPTTTAWWQTTAKPTTAAATTTTTRRTPSTTAWWQSTKAPTSARTTTAASAEAEAESEEGVDFSECGTRNLESDRIVGGEEAAKGEFPWIAGIFKGRRQFCGGSLIDKTHILTAAHCVAHMTPYDVRRLIVRLGDHDISTSREAKHEEFAVSRIIRHKGFSESTLHTDIALLTLKTPVTYKDNIRPVCLAEGKQRYTGEAATVAGWGTLSEAGRQPSKLQKVSLTVWKNSKCAKSYGRSAPGGIIRSMLCAGKANKDSCSGDSGGPLMSVGAKVTQIGVVSWGIGCAKPQYPGVYTRVTDLLEWIERNRDVY